jgi:hypothetical protein
MTILVNLVLGVALILAGAMFTVFARDTVAAKRVLAGAAEPDAIALAKQKVILHHGAEAVAVVFAIGVVVSFMLINK